MITARPAVLACGPTGLAVLAPSVPPWSAITAWAIAGLDMGGAFATCSAAILESEPAGQEGAASGALQIAWVLDATLATGIGGAIVGTSLAGVPPRADIAAVDVLMLLVLAATTARGVEERWGDS